MHHTMIFKFKKENFRREIPTRDQDEEVRYKTLEEEFGEEFKGSI